MTPDIDCYDTKPVPALVAKAHVSAHPKKRAIRKPLYRKDKEAGIEYPCDSPSLPSAAAPVEPEPYGEFTPVPWATLDSIVTFEQPIPELPPTFETASYAGGFPSFGGGGFVIREFGIARPVPEPSVAWLLALGLVFLKGRLR